jgi:hypothetical protein
VATAAYSNDEDSGAKSKSPLKVPINPLNKGDFEVHFS